MYQSWGGNQPSTRSADSDLRLSPSLPECLERAGFGRFFLTEFFLFGKKPTGWYITTLNQCFYGDIMDGLSRKGDKTKQRIIEKSLQLFSAKGFFNTTINDILEATCLTKGGLYAHFRNKDEIWDAAYERAAMIWTNIVYGNSRKIEDPLDRLKKIIKNDMQNYLGANVFAGGCFFLNALVDFAGQAPDMNRMVLKGFHNFSRVIESCLKEADQTDMLKPGMNCTEVADFILVSLNGAAALYAATKDRNYWQGTLHQLHTYIDLIKK
jgi:TetR/AcrR family transcriptional regulator, transcriptional repressor for nem operon